MKKTRSHLLKCYKPFLAALLMTYLGFSLMNGERGVFAYFTQTHQQKLLSQELAQLQHEREQMEIQVSHLRNSSLDLDLLDEQMRRMSGLMAEDEKLILLP